MVAPLLIGREEELGRLKESLLLAQNGQGGVCLVSGGPGMGKSRLTLTLAAEAIKEGTEVYWGRCWESGGAPAFWPWTQVLRSLYRSKSEKSFGDLSQETQEALGHFLPELKGKDVVEEFSPDEARFRLMDATSRFLCDDASDAPLLILLEDLHAGDQATVQFLDFIEPLARSARLLIVGTYRELEAGASCPALLTVAQRCKRLSLPPLGFLATESVLSATLGRSPPRKLVTKVLQTSEGNPLFLTEMAEIVRQHGDDAIGDIVPRQIESAISRRLLQLSSRTRKILEIAAVLGRDFSTSSLLPLCEVPVSDLEVGLEEASTTGFIHRLAPGRFRFEHILIRGVLYQGLADSDKRDLHHKHARNLELGLISPSARLSSEVVHHYLAAHRASEAMSALIQSGKSAIEQYAYDDAIEVLASGMSALNESSLTEHDDRAEVLLLLAKARLLSGDVERGRQDCHEVARLARLAGSYELLARAALECGRIYVLAQVDPGLVDLLQEARATLPSDALELRVRVMGRLASAMQPAPIPEEACALAEEAIELCRGLGDPALLLSVFRSAGSALMDIALPERRLVLNEEYAVLAEKMRDRSAIFRAHCWLAFDYFALGRHGDARRAIRRVEEVAALIAQPHYQWRALAFRAMEQGFLGHIAEALALFDHAEALGLEAADPNVPRCMSYARIWLRIMLDPGADRSEEEGVLKAAGRDNFSSLVGFGSLARRGKLDELRAGFRASMVEENVLTLDLECLTELSTVAIALGDRNLGHFLHGKLKDFDARFVNGGMTSMTWKEPAALYLGRLAAFLGNSTEARSGFVQAVSLLEKAGALPSLGWALLDFAHFERAEGHGEESRTLAARAQAIGSSLSIPALEEAGALWAGEQALEKLKLPQKLVPEEERQRLLLEKEGEVWRASFESESVQLSDTKGIRLLARLLAEPCREVHVLDLQSPGCVFDGGDAGEFLDPEARSGYKRRVLDLHSQLEEAQTHQDVGRSERLRAELEFIERELSRAVGLGGNVRRSGGAAERARVNVQRRLKDATRRLAENSPAMGRHIQRSLRTGTYCSYQP